MTRVNSDLSVFQIAVEKAPVLVLLYRKKFLYANPFAQKLFGYSLEELKKMYVWDLLVPSDRKRIQKIIERRIRGENIPKAYKEITFITKSGERKKLRLYATTVRWKGRYAGLAVGIDITREKTLENRLKKERERLLRLTLYDTLTGLASRVLFLERLRDLLKFAQRRDENLCVAILDLVKFKEVNATYGMEISDLVLKETARRLKGTLRSGDLVSRFFADEFGVALSGLKDVNSISRVVEKVREVFNQPFDIHGFQIYINADIGVSVYPKDDINAEGLIRKAELALSKARETGPGAVSFYSEEVETKVAQIAVLRNSLSRAISKGEIEVFYQPVVRLKDRKVVGIEALARWRHPNLGLVTPDKFIPVAEDTGLITEIGELVLKNSLRDLARLMADGFEDLTLAVNFSTKQFLDEDLTEKIKKFLKLQKVPPSHFILEITESTAMKDPARASEILHGAKKVGIKVAIDDFGTGYSSMNYLIEFEVDKIKVDRSFINPMLESQKAKSIVKTIIDLSHSIGSVALAEGIETQEQLNALVEMGCDEGQGFLFSRPVDFNSLLKFMRKWNESKIIHP